MANQLSRGPLRLGMISYYGVAQKSHSVASGSITASSGSMSTGITITGARLGDFVDVAPPVVITGLTYRAVVSANDTVLLQLSNPSTSTVVYDAGAWKFRITR